MSGSPATQQPTAPELVLTRVFDAPRELVFRAWTEPEHFAAWYGPRGFDTPVCEIDARPGGAMRYAMRSPQGQEQWFAGEVIEVRAPALFVCTQVVTDAAGSPLRAIDVGFPEGVPDETLLTVVCIERDGRTRMTVHHTLPLDIANAVGAAQGWTEAFDRLAEAVATAH